jgi:hypothetical protein
MVRRTGVLLVEAIVAGCATGTWPAPVTPAPVPSSSVAAPVPDPAASTTASPLPPSSSPGGADGMADPATFLQLCDRWPAAVDGDPIPCEELVGMAITSAAVAGARVTRVETSYGCSTGDECEPVASDQAHVTIASNLGAVELEVTRTTDGSLAITGSIPVDRPAPLPFDAPPPSAPAIDDAPAEVNQRAALPLCGHEVAEPYGPPDTAARDCFWNGVRAGSPVELVSSSTDTEGRPSTTIYRYAGTGGVEIVYNDETGWFRMFSGLEPFPDGKVFDLAGMTTTPTAVPGP